MKFGELKLAINPPSVRRHPNSGGRSGVCDGDGDQRLWKRSMAMMPHGGVEGGTNGGHEGWW